MEGGHWGGASGVVTPPAVTLCCCVCVCVCCRIAGVEGRHVAFLFTDNHIVSEAFVEDMNNILNSGDITGLFAQDEKERIFSDIR